jgi:zinc transport system permease protein
MDEFLLYALLAGTGTALVAGPLGSFIVWRRMAYFGDTMAHSALLGVALGLLLEIGVSLAVLLVVVAVALLLLWMQQHWRLGLDSLLGILAHGSLSLGLVAVAFMEHVRLDLMGYLFGDILAVGPVDLLMIWGGGLLVLLVLWRIWHGLLAITVHEELARVEGVPVDRLRLVFMLLIALVIAVSMKIVGVLLITALMIIPAATARRFSRTPRQMAGLASVNALLSVMVGLAGSLQWDTPAGPSIVVAATLLFIVSRSIPSSV